MSHLSPAPHSHEHSSRVRATLVLCPLTSLLRDGVMSTCSDTLLDMVAVSISHSKHGRSIWLTRKRNRKGGVVVQGFDLVLILLSTGFGSSLCSLDAVVYNLHPGPHQSCPCHLTAPISLEMTLLFTHVRARVHENSYASFTLKRVSSLKRMQGTFGAV